ncbi:MAG: sulfurtransferase complex subunit TusB [Candidatus Nezhaarchaeota archaeon]|nr:sulfurtransferase complex subunit TusB [Candidatus Nezhaarchaeota archaeon]MCX8141572.1 sulfurtransferase complex subunit TusB [Candidatus Nezhaarchaeota archaeon]MDW8049839.1 sulfurtransferase complex subunit TusB [Nitrososphaerota archaeon]
MSILYVLYKSPLTHRVPLKALDIIEKQVDRGYKVNVLLLSDAVIALVSKSLKPRLKVLRSRGSIIYALKEDLEARGITSDIATPVSYSEVVDLIEAHEKVSSWS